MIVKLLLLKQVNGVASLLFRDFYYLQRMEGGTQRQLSVLNVILVLGFVQLVLERLG